MPVKTVKKTQSPAPAIAPRLLAVGPAAAYLGIGPWALRKLHWDGVLRGINVGRRLLWDKHALDRYVDGLLAEISA